VRGGAVRGCIERRWRCRAPRKKGARLGGFHPPNGPGFDWISRVFPRPPLF
jgi:hypothetical protein